MGSDSSRDSGLIFFLAVLEVRAAWSESHQKLYSFRRKTTPKGKADREVLGSYGTAAPPGGFC